MSARTLAIPCLFCFAERGGKIQRTAEHFLSRPVAKAFGIDRDQGELSLVDEAGKVRKVRLSGFKRRCVCSDCNNGWMNRLENAMGAVADWFNGGDVPLSEDLELILRRWALSRHILLCAIDGNERAFFDVENNDDFGYVVPPSSLARGLYEEDMVTIRGAAIGVARSSAGLEIGYAFGLPRILPPEAKPGLARFAPVSILTLGEFQVWVITPMIFETDVRVPEGVFNCQPGLKANDLPPLPHIAKPAEPVVEFLDLERSTAEFERAQRWLVENAAAIDAGEIDPNGLD